MNYIYKKLVFLVLSIMFLFDEVSSYNSTNEQLLPQQVKQTDIKVVKAVDNQITYSQSNEFRDWTFILNTETNTAIRAFGRKVKIEGFEVLDERNVRNAAEVFLNRYKNTLNIIPEELKLARAKHVNGKWYLSYHQFVNDCEVLLSEVELRISDKAEVFAFGAKFYNGLYINTKPELSYNAAVKKACADMKIESKESELIQNSKKYILPIKSAKGFDYKLVYHLKSKRGSELNKYQTYVDANSGKVLWKQKKNFDFALKSTGFIKPKYSTDDSVKVSFPYQYFNIDGVQYTTDSNGEINIDKAHKVDATLSGPFCIVSSDRADITYNDTTLTHDKEVDWNAYAHLYEQNLFYHTNKIHDFVKEIDTSMTCMDIQMSVEVEFSGDQANAYSQGDLIKFLAVDSKDIYFATTAAVLYHEYGHSLNTLLYRDNGVQSQRGMENLLCQEAMADVLAGLVIDNEDIGQGALRGDYEGRGLRHLDNDFIYPDSLIGEGHHDGQVLSSVYWDLKESVSMEYAKWISHYVKYGLPDDPNDEVALIEFFVETLIADDNDADLSNGTPHFEEIMYAFNRHHLGSILLAKNAFSHQVHNDTVSTGFPFRIEFVFEDTQVIEVTPTNLSLIYSTDMFETTLTTGVEYVDGKFYADIPSQGNGTIVQYLVKGLDYYTSQEIVFGEAKTKEPFTFLVGFSEIYSDDFEENLWTLGDDNDDATSGEWEVDIPEEVDFSSYGLGGKIQPKGDHSVAGNYCLVTGSTGGFNFMENALVGTTTAYSPAVSLQNSNTVFISFYYWFELMSLGGGVDEAYLDFEVSYDNGDNWNLLTRIDKTTKAEWKECRVLLNDLELTNEQVLFRFIGFNTTKQANGYPIQLAEFLVDDLKIMAPAFAVSVDDYEQNAKVSISPNPFFENALIDFAGMNFEPTEIKVLNLNGDVVRTFESVKELKSKTVLWDGRDELNQEVSPGLYFILISDEEHVEMQKVIKY